MVKRQDPEEPARRDAHPGDGVARGTARMEAFADGVFAIAFTLPVVTIKLPDGGPNFAAELASLWPQYLGCALSALVIGLYWVHHHFSGAIYRTTGHLFLLATIVFLAAIGFIAFPTRAFAEHIMDPAAREAGAQYYAVALGATSVTWLVKWRTGRARGHVDERLDPAYVYRLDRNYGRSTALMVAAALLSFVQWEVGLGLALIVTLFLIPAPETPVYRTAVPVVEGEG